VVKLQAAHSLWLQYGTGGLTWTDGVCQRIYSEYLDVPENVLRLTDCQLNGTAQPSLALESLQETEKLGGPERERVEGVIAGALGSMYLGE
jgi:hypothetical protein